MHKNKELHTVPSKTVDGRMVTSTCWKKHLEQKDVIIRPFAMKFWSFCINFLLFSMSHDYLMINLLHHNAPPPNQLKPMRWIEHISSRFQKTKHTMRYVRYLKPISRYQALAMHKEHAPRKLVSCEDWSMSMSWTWRSNVALLQLHASLKCDVAANCH